MNLLTNAATSIVSAFTSCMEPLAMRRLRAESLEDEAPFLEIREENSQKYPLKSTASSGVESKYMEMIQNGMALNKVKDQMVVDGMNPNHLDLYVRNFQEKSFAPSPSQFPQTTCAV